VRRRTSRRRHWSTIDDVLKRIERIVPFPSAGRQLGLARRANREVIYRCGPAAVASSRSYDRRLWKPSATAVNAWRGAPAR
jgi:hypothetical protein